MCCSPDCLLAVFAIIFPPMAVWIKVGICTADSLINIALCCLGYLPGLLHAWYIIFKYPEYDPDLTVIEQRTGGYPAIIPPVGRSAAPPGSGYQPVHPGWSNAFGFGTKPYHHHQRGDVESHGAYTDAGPYIPPLPSSSAAAASPQASSAQQQHYQSYGAVQDEYNGDGDGAAAGASRPPTYAEAVKGDYKIQHD